LQVAGACDDVGETELLEGIARQCDVVEAHWDEVDEWCAEIPPTLVHGDFRPKNVHIVDDGRRVRLLAMDWETAGWGAPAADLASVRGLGGESIGVTTYLSVVRESWPGLRLRALLRTVEAGKLFRRVAAIDWCSANLSFRRQKSMASMRVHRAEMASVIGYAGWA
jgi:aminoglycoside phosphotransferase (APT) family kinase protein